MPEPQEIEAEAPKCTREQTEDVCSKPVIKNEEISATEVTESCTKETEESKNEEVTATDATTENIEESCTKEADKDAESSATEAAESNPSSEVPQTEDSPSNGSGVQETETSQVLTETNETEASSEPQEAHSEVTVDNVEAAVSNEEQPNPTPEPEPVPEVSKNEINVPKEINEPKKINGETPEIITQNGNGTPRKSALSTSVDSENVRKAYEDVRSDSTETEWAVFKFSGSRIVCSATGSDFGKFKGQFSENDRAFGYIRVQTGDELSIRRKFLLVTWVGPSVSVLQRAKMSTDKAVIKNIVSNFAVELQVENVSDINLDNFVNQLNKAGGANYGTGIREN